MDLISPFVNTLTNLKKLITLKDWFEDRRYAKLTDSREIAMRVLQVLDAHDISVAKIPVLFPEFGFKIRDFNTLDSTVECLTPEFLITLSKHFYINPNWLETGEGPIQKVFEYGYNFKDIYNLIIKFYTQEDMKRRDVRSVLMTNLLSHQCANSFNLRSIPMRYGATYPLYFDLKLSGRSFQPVILPRQFLAPQQHLYGKCSIM